MFSFFRRYQRFFFVIITVVIVISFSFFGTYSTLSTNPEDNSVVFVGVDGSKVHRKQFTDYLQFLSVEAQDLYGAKSARFNPANDGYFTKDIIESGVGSIIWRKINDNEALDASILAEKDFVSFSHPQYPFIGVESVWAYFAPNIATSFNKYKEMSSSKAPNYPELFDAKIELYAAQRQFPPQLIKQVLQYQISQMNLAPLAIDNSRLLLFGYDSPQDWFGKKFLDACVIWVYDTARMAEKQGLEVSEREALFMLLKNCQDLLSREPGLKQMGYESPGQLLADSLKNLGVDQNSAVIIMRDILLSRKLIGRAETAVAVSPALFKPLVQASNSFIRLDQYQLPESLRIQSLDQMYKIQLWIDAVRKGPKSSTWSDVLALPTDIYSPEELLKTNPELVQRRFRINWASVNVEDLSDALPLRDVWAWQSSDLGWKKLLEQFPVLKSKVAQEGLEQGPQDRLKSIDLLSQDNREKINLFSRKQIILQNPDRIREALSSKEMTSSAISIRAKGGKLPFEGVSNQEEFKKLLLSAAVGEQDSRLDSYTQDNTTFCRVIVLDRADSDEVIPLEQALSDGVLNSMLDSVLHAAYVKTRNLDPKVYRQENGEWKPLSAVQDEIAEKHFLSLISALDQAREVYKSQFPMLCNWNNVREARFAVRFMPYVQQIWVKVQKDPGMINDFIEEVSSSSLFETASTLRKLKWGLVKKTVDVVRKDGSAVFAYASLAQLPPGAWVSPQFKLQDGLAFAFLTEKGELPFDWDLRSKTMSFFETLGGEVGRRYAREVCDQMSFQTR